MLHPAVGMFGCRARVIIKALTLECRTKQNADLGRQVLLLTVLITILLIPQVVTVPTLTPLIPQAHTAPILTAPILLILPAPTKWSPCSARAVISCITILPTPRFTATAK